MSDLLTPSATASDPPASLNPAAWFKVTLPVAMIAACAELALAIINNSALPVYFTHGLFLNKVIYTNVLVPFFLSEVLFKSPLGVLADRWGRKPLMVLGPAISIFTPLILVSIHYPPHQVVLPLLFLFGFLRLLDGLGAAALWPAMFAYIGDHVHQDKRAAAMGVLNVMYMMGLALGFLAGGWANDTFGPVLSGEASLRSAMGGVYRSMRNNIKKHLHHPHGIHLHIHALTIHATRLGLPVDIDRPAQFYPSFYLGSILFALATIIGLITLKDRAADSREGLQEHHDDSQGGAVSWASFVAAVKTVPHLMSIAFVAFFGIGCIALLVKLFALEELGVSETEFGLLVLWPAIIIGILAVPLGHFSDKFGKVRSVRGGFLVAGVGMWSLVILFHFFGARDAGLILGASLLGVGFVIAFPAWMALLTTIGGDKSRGTVIGAVSTAQGVGTLAGAELGGFLYDRASSNPHVAHLAPFIASAIFLTIATVMTFLMIHPDDSGKAKAS